jgi:hypothetical protein
LVKCDDLLYDLGELEVVSDEVEVDLVSDDLEEEVSVGEDPHEVDKNIFLISKFLTFHINSEFCILNSKFIVMTSKKLQKIISVLKD